MCGIRTRMGRRFHRFMRLECECAPGAISLTVERTWGDQWNAEADKLNREMKFSAINHFYFIELCSLMF